MLRTLILSNASTNYLGSPIKKGWNGRFKSVLGWKLFQSINTTESVGEPLCFAPISWELISGNLHRKVLWKSNLCHKPNTGTHLANAPTWKGLNLEDLALV